MTPKVTYAIGSEAGLETTVSACQSSVSSSPPRGPDTSLACCGIVLKGPEPLGCPGGTVAVPSHTADLGLRPGWACGQRRHLQLLPPKGLRLGFNARWLPS